MCIFRGVKNLDQRAVFAIEVIKTQNYFVSGIGFNIYIETDHLSRCLCYSHVENFGILIKDQARWVLRDNVFSSYCGPACIPEDNVRPSNTRYRSAMESYLHLTWQSRITDAYEAEATGLINGSGRYLGAAVKKACSNEPDNTNEGSHPVLVQEALQDFHLICLTPLKVASFPETPLGSRISLPAPIKDRGRCQVRQVIAPWARVGTKLVQLGNVPDCVPD